MMLKVLKVVKKCSKSQKLPSNCGLVYPWEGGGGIIYNFKYKSRRLFRVGVKSRNYT